MDSATWCRTPAAVSAATRLWPEVSKNSSTALSSNEGELARSITTCVPAMASSRPSPVMLLTPVLGEAATTSWPPWRRIATVFEPIRPVPPITTIFIPNLLVRSPASRGLWGLCHRLGEQLVALDLRRSSSRPPSHQTGIALSIGRRCVGRWMMRRHITPVAATSAAASMIRVVFMRILIGASLHLPERPESGAKLRGAQFGLLPRCEVPALVDLVEVGQVGIRAPGPCLRGPIDVLRKYRDCHRQRDLGRLLRGRGNDAASCAVLPVQPACRGRGVRQPVQRDVVEHVVLRRRLPGI